MADIVIHPADTEIIYAAISSGGVLRSTDGGITWVPMADHLPVITIGAIALDPQDLDVIYVGTGEAGYCFRCHVLARPQPAVWGECREGR